MRQAGRNLAAAYDWGAKAEREAIVKFIRETPDGAPEPVWPLLMRFIEALASDIEAGAHHKQEEAKTT